MAASTFNILKFKSVIKGIQRSSLFTVNFTFPAGVPTTIQGLENLSLVVSSANIPASTVSDIQVKYMGRAVHFSGNRTDNQGAWSTRIILNNDWSIYKTIYAWNVLLNGPINNTMADQYQENLKATATISTYTSNDSKNGEWTLYGIWPASIDQLQLSWDNDTPLTPSVSWYYDYSYPTILNGTSTQDIIKQ